MTTETTTETAVDDTTAADPTTQPGETTAPQDGKGGNREARYRRQLRETETERDELRSRFEALQRGDAERLAAAKLSKPAALWASGVQLSDLLDDRGELDAERVEAAAQRAADELGAAPPVRRPQPDRGQGGGNGAAPGPSWNDAFKPEKR